jgi:hypothetical protein
MWEYMYIDEVGMDNLVARANKLGKLGWEAVSFTTTKQGFGWGRHIMILKRRVAKDEE